MIVRHEIEPSPWRDPRFRVFAAGNAVNNIGESVYDVALPLLAYELTGSLAVMGVLAAMTPATLLLGPLLGGTFGPILLLPLVSGLGTSGTFIALGLCGLVPVLLLVRFRRLWRAGGTTDPSPKPSSTTTEESAV